jgi:hypothetical protein
MRQEGKECVDGGFWEEGRREEEEEAVMGKEIL